MTRIRSPFFFSFFIFLISAGCTKKDPPFSKRPKLVVLLVADQLRADSIYRYADMMTPKGGFAFLKKGAHAVGRYGHQNTYTSSGHALISTGSYGYANGITQNRWFNRATQQVEAMLADPETKPLGDPESPDDKADQESSPKNLIGTTLSDEIRLAQPAAKAIAIAGKSRSAVLLAGRQGQAFWYTEKTGHMVSSSFYAQSLPTWVQKWNEHNMATKWFSTHWNKTRNTDRYQGQDDAPGEVSVHGLGTLFPHSMRGKNGIADSDFYEAVLHSSFGIQLIFNFANAAIVQEQLGQRGVTDFLAISVSSLDLIGHVFGGTSHEYQEALATLDDELGKLFFFLEQRFPNKEDVLIAFTADHGTTPSAEQFRGTRLEAGRIKRQAIQDVVQKKLEQEVGPGNWVLAIEEPSVYLNTDLIQKSHFSTQQIEDMAGQAIMSLSGMAGYLTRTQILQGQIPQTEMARAITRSYYPPRGGNVVLWTVPLFFFGRYAERPAGAMHGSMSRHDTDVPVFLSGPWFAPIDGGVLDMIDLPATISHVLHISPPALCEGRPWMSLLQKK